MSSRNDSNYNVRVYNRKTAERTLLKGFNGRVIDIAFAFASSVVLGVVDEVGGIFVYDITETAEAKITYPFYSVKKFYIMSELFFIIPLIVPIDECEMMHIQYDLWVIF